MIKKLNHTDLAIATMIYEVFQVSYSVEAKLLNATYFPPLHITAEAMQKKETSFFGFWKADKLAAVIELEKMHDTSTDICSLVVSPTYFRQGIASALLAYGITYFKSAIVTVETGVLNSPAIRLYESFNFKEEKRWMTSFGIEKVKFILKVS